MGTLFQTVRERVTARDAAEFYGLEVTRFGKALCPWHSDRHPSLSFDKRTGRCHCFSCGAGGDAIDLTAKLLGLSPLEAAKRLNEDFNLSIEDTGPAPRPMGETLAQKRRREERERLREYCRLCDVLHESAAVLARFTPESSEGSAEFDAALRRYCMADLQLDNF